MNKSTQLTNLFILWKEFCKDEGSFYIDGIINEQKFSENVDGKKILYIAKEPNATNPESSHNYNFRLEWNDSINPPTYNFATRISEWTYGILNSFPKYLDAKNHISYLKKIAFMNLKKSGGKGNTEVGIIKSHILNPETKSFVLKEIEIIDPDIIVLCTSFENEVRSIFGSELHWSESGYDIKLMRWKKKKIIDFYHPSSRNVGSASYSLLQNVFNSKAFNDL